MKVLIIELKPLNAFCFLFTTGQEIRTFPHKNYVTCVQFHPAELALFLAGTFKSAILCWDTRTGNVSMTTGAL